jgi:hypothetical protein
MAASRLATTARKQIPKTDVLRRGPRAEVSGIASPACLACGLGTVRWRPKKRHNGYRDDAPIRLLVSTLRRNCRPQCRAGHRPPSVRVPPVTKLGETAADASDGHLAAAVSRPAWSVHNLWRSGPRRRQAPARLQAIRLGPAHRTDTKPQAAPSNTPGMRDRSVASWKAPPTSTCLAWRQFLAGQLPQGDHPRIRPRETIALTRRNGEEGDRS